MLNKSYRWMFALTVVLLVVTLTVVALPVHVSAQKAADTTANRCFSCHEDLYYLHDTGRYCCVTEHKDRCVNCHEGDATAIKEEQAHVGLIAHPQENNGAKCLECHTPEDTKTRLAQFAAAGGFDTVIKATSYTPSVLVASGFPEVSEETQLKENIPLAVAAVLLFGLWLILVRTSPTKP